MVASIKHRKSSATCASLNDAEDDSIHSRDEHPPSLFDSTHREGIKTYHGRLSIASHYFIGFNMTVALAVTVFISTSVFVLVIPALPSKSADQSENHPSLLLTFLDLRTNNGTPLTGTYLLGKEYLLQKNSAIAAPASDTIHETVAGRIHFPHVELSLLLKEEAVEPAPIPFSNQRHQTMTQPSYLSDKSSFDSVLNNNINEYTDSTTEKIVDYAILTRCGHKMGHVPNQDRSFLVNFFIDVLPKKEFEPYTALLMGIFDGHGPRGHEVSHYLALEFPTIFARNMRRQNVVPLPMFESPGNSTEHAYQISTSIKSALNETFLEADADEPLKDAGGSTASVLFYPGTNSKVYIANAGDSTILIVSYCKTKRKSTVVYQNRKHKPHLPDERQRIENAGGIVKIPLSLLRGGGGSINDGIQESSRIIIPDKNGDSFRGMALAMSRSIGDVEGKRVGLTAEPEIDVWDVNDWMRQFDIDHKTDNEVRVDIFIFSYFSPAFKVTQTYVAAVFCSRCYRWYT